MFFKKTHIIFLLFILVALLTSAFLLLFAFRNLVNQNNLDGLPVVIHIFILLILVLSIVQFFYVLPLLNKLKTSEKSDAEEKQDIVSDAVKEVEEKTEEVKKEESINVQSVLKRLIPSKQDEMEVFCEQVLSNISKEFEIGQGLFYMKEEKSEDFSVVSTYAYYSTNEPAKFKEGETLSGQVVKNQKLLQITDVPENYMNILSGLGQSNPRAITFIPIIQNEKAIGLIEIASFKKFSDQYLNILDELSKSIADILFKKVKSTEKKNDSKK